MVNNILHRCVTISNHNFRFSNAAIQRLTDGRVSPAEIFGILENPVEVVCFESGEKTFIGDNFLFITKPDGDVDVVVRVVSIVKADA